MTDQEKLTFLENAIKTLFKSKTLVALTPDTNLLDLGLDSLDIVELQMYYEEQTNIETSTGSRIVTIKDLMALMK